MSHVKNVQAFGKLTGICTGYGGQYNPGKQNLQVNAMATLMTKAQQAMEAVNEAQSRYDNATNNRVTGFKDLKPFSSRVWVLLKASGTDKLTVMDALASHRKIIGSRRIKVQFELPADGGGQKPKSGYSFGRDYASLANYFARLVETVSNEPLYNPNEPEMKVAGLQKKVRELNAMNQAVTDAEIRLTQARRSRNELYYEKSDNLFDTAQNAKLYVRGIFGYRSSQHQEVRRLSFTKPTT